MAHFAEIGINNVVKQVVVIDNIKCMNDGGVEDIDISMDYIRSVYGHGNFVKCSYNTREGAHSGSGTPLRANYPGIGSIYDSTNDIWIDFSKELYRFAKAGSISNITDFETVQWLQPSICQKC